MGTDIVLEIGSKFVNHLGDEALKQIAPRLVDVVLENPPLLDTLFKGCFCLAGLRMLPKIVHTWTTPDGCTHRVVVERDDRAAEGSYARAACA